MRKRIWIPCAVALAVLLLFILIGSRERQQSVSPEPEPGQALTHQSSRPERPKPPQTQQTQNVVAPPAVVPAVASVPAPSVENSNALPAELLNTWQAPIEFYGKVVDENTNPVAGATVNFHWVETPTEDGNRTSATESDAAGLFSLTGARGPSLTVSVSKEGYYTSRSGLPDFKYGFFAHQDYSPDASNPVIFKLRKKGTPAEALVAVKRNYRIPRDGTLVAIDVATGEKANGESGNLVVRCWTNDAGKRSGEKYDWRCVVTIPGGGAVATGEEFPFLAPENGYKPAVEITMPADRGDWKDDVDLRFFYRLADGRYGRMTFSMIAGGQHFCMIDSVLNPSGSRNLEPAN